MRKAGILEDPYEGDQPYIFISYSHIDRPEVIKIIRLLQEAISYMVRRGY